MSRNSFRQIEAQINEYEDMRAHARMERNAELRAKLDSYPVADDPVRVASGIDVNTVNRNIKVLYGTEEKTNS